jgi:orotate phosphoribosyltransferase
MNNAVVGSLVGADLIGKIMLVDDVMTASKAIRESMEIIKAHNAELSGVLIALDRQEKGQGELSAIQEVGRDFGTTVISIVSLADVVTSLNEQIASQPYLTSSLESINKYRVNQGI